MYETIKTELSGGILTLTLNRPDKMNAYTEQMNAELLDFYRNVDADDDVRVIVVTGAGRAFCAGMDLSEGGSTFASEQSAEDYRDLGGQVSNQIYEVKKPVIAAIDGFCLGGGMELALACHMRICSDRSRLGQPEINLGVIPGAGGTQRLTRFVGKSKAMEMCLTGRMMDAGEAELASEDDESPQSTAEDSSAAISGTSVASFQPSHPFCHTWCLASGAAWTAATAADS